MVHMSARHSLVDCFRNRTNITGRVLSYVSIELRAQRYGFGAGAKAILYGVNIYSLTQNFNEN